MPPPPMPRRSSTWPGSRVAPLRNRTAWRFRRSVQPKHGALVVLPDLHESALLEHADRAGILGVDARMARPLGYLLEEGAERRCRDASAPVLAADPVADQAPLLGLPADDVPRHLAVGLDRAVDGVGSCAVLLPVGVERLLVLGGDAGHGHPFGVALMLEEDGQVG